MTRMQLDVGAKFIRDCSKQIVLEIDQNGNVIFEDMRTGRRQSSLRMVLEKELLIGAIYFDEGLTEDCLPSACPIDLLPDEIRAVVRRREAYTRRLVELSTGRSARSVLDEVRNQISRELSDRCPPSNSSLMRWLKAWRTSGGTSLSLVPGYKNRGRKKKRLNPRTVELVQEVIRERFWTREKPHLKSIMGDLTVRVYKENMSRGASDLLEVPSYPTVFRIEKCMDAYERMAARDGKAAAERFFRPVLNQLKVEAPMDLVQIDHTILDIHVLAPVEGWVARPRITVALDTFSRMPLGIYVGFVSAGYESVMLCLKRSIEAKDEFLSGLSSVEGSWPCYGLPRTILVDNGMEFHSNSFRDACSSLGISIVNHPVCEPRYKGAVERFFRTLNQGLISQLQGRTFSNPVEKGDYDSVAKASIPFELFQEVLYKWVVEVYARRFHRGIEAVPIEKWEQGVKAFPVDLPRRPDDLLALISKSHTRTLTASGIEINSAHYNSLELNEIYRRAEKPQKLLVKVDPQDLGHVFVFDPISERFIDVPCLDDSLAGLSEWQHKIVRKLIAEKAGNADRSYDTAKAFREIENALLVGKKHKRRKSNAKAARFAEYGLKSDAPNQVEKEAAGVHRAQGDGDQTLAELLEEARSRGWLAGEGGEE